MAKTRRATLKDVPALAKLAAKTLRGQGWGTRTLAEYIADNPGCSWVRVDGANVIGWVMAIGPSIWVLAVHPDHQRQGHGAALLDAAKAATKKIGWDTVDLKLRAGNKAAMAFYKAHGFKRTGTFGTYGDGETRVVMKARI